MAHIAVNTSQAAGPLSRVAHAVADLRARYARYKMYRTTLDELQALTSRELADLDLHRSMLRRVAYEAAYK